MNPILLLSLFIFTWLLIFAGIVIVLDKQDRRFFNSELDNIDLKEKLRLLSSFVMTKKG